MNFTVDMNAESRLPGRREAARRLSLCATVTISILVGEAGGRCREGARRQSGRAVTMVMIHRLLKHRVAWAHRVDQSAATVPW